MELTPDTPDAQLARLSIPSRGSQRRRRTLERLANICTAPDVSVAVRFSTDEAYCHVPDATDGDDEAGDGEPIDVAGAAGGGLSGGDRAVDYEVVIPTQGYDQVRTEMAPERWDKRVQVALLFHELGHVKYSDFGRLSERLEATDPEWREVLRRLYNAAEDGVVETQMAAEFNVREDFVVLNSTLAALETEQHDAYNELFAETRGGAGVDGDTGVGGSAIRAVVDEVPQDPQPGLAGLLGVELRAEDVPRLVGDHRRERDAVVGGRHHGVGVVGLGVVGVDEVGVLAVDALDDRVLALDVQFVPTHVRHFLPAIEPDVRPRDEVEPLDLPLAGVVGLLACGQEHLHPEADPEDGLAAVGGGRERFAERARVLHPLAERAHAGEDDPVGGREVVGVVCDLDRGAGAFEAALCAAEVAEPVVHENDLRCRLNAHTPTSRGRVKSLPTATIRVR